MAVSSYLVLFDALEPSLSCVDAVLLLPLLLPPVDCSEAIVVCLRRFSLVRGSELSDMGNKLLLARFAVGAFSADCNGCSSELYSRFSGRGQAWFSFALEGS